MVIIRAWAAAPYNKYTKMKPDDVPGCPADAESMSAEPPGRDGPPRDDDTDENLIVGYASIEGKCQDTGARSEVPEGEVRNAGEVLCDDEVCRICCVRCLYSFRELCVCCYRC